ncbi:MAG: membrane-binding protein [Bacteroidia bacterium]
MKQVFLIVLSSIVFLISCAEKKETKVSITPDPVDSLLEIPDTMVDHSALYYHNKTSLWTLNDQLYSGYAVSFYQDSSLKDKIGFLNGRKQNQAIQWYPDGHYKQVANYHKGKLHGEKKTWSANSGHILIAQLNYYLGKAHGEQKKWYPSGELLKKLNLNMGREEGIQQAFRKNGDLFANYEAKAGRIFGLKKSVLCYGLENENVQYEN